MAEAEDKVEQMEQLRYLYNLYLQKYEALLNDISMYSQAQTILLRNADLMGRLGKVENSNTLIGLEGGLYIDAKVQGINRVMTYVGGGYLVEKTPQEAKDFFLASEKEERALIEKLDQEKQKTEKDLTDIVYSMDAIKQ